MLTQGRLKKLYWCCERAGALISRRTKKKVGHLNRRQLVISVDGVKYPIKDLIWLSSTGDMPTKEDPVVFKNGNRLDSSLENLCLRSQVSTKLCESKRRDSCGQVLPISEFHVRSADGLHDCVCKSCDAALVSRTAKMVKVTLTEVRDSFEYSPETGILTRRGKIEKRLNYYGYGIVVFRNKSFMTHRLIWWLYTGYKPKKGEEIDHINHVRSDNRWENLRLVSHEENLKNQKPNIRNTSGVAGVYYRKKQNKWMAAIQIDGKQQCLGYFEDMEEAITERKEAEAQYGYHKNHGQ